MSITIGQIQKQSMRYSLPRLALAAMFVIGGAVFLAPKGASATISLVQQTTASAAAATTLTITLPAPPKAGDALVVFSSNDAAAGHISVTGGGVAWMQGGSVGIHVTGDVWYGLNASGASTTITVTYPQVANGSVNVSEWSGILAANALDVVWPGNSGAGGTTVTTVSATTTNAYDLVVGGFVQNLNASISSGPTDSFSGLNSIGGTSPFPLTAPAYRIVSSTGAYSTSWTVNTITGWDSILIALKGVPPGIQVSSRSDTLSDSRPSATSNHTVVFTTNTQVTGSSTMILTLPSLFTVPSVLDCGDVDAATSSQFNFNYPSCAATATAWGFSVTGSVVTLQAPTDSTSTVHVATGTAITIKIGSNATVGQQGAHWITNPSTDGVYTISVGGSFGGSGNMLVSINSGVTVQVSIPESLAFTVSSVAAVNCTADDGASVTAVGTSPTSISLGTFPVNTFSIGCQDLVVSTNAGAGYSLTAQETSAMSTVDGKYTIPDTTCDAGDCSVAMATTWVTPTKNGFGHTCFNQSGSDCNPAYANGTKFKPLNSPTGAVPGSIAFVQGNTGSAGAGGSSINVAFSSNNTAGNLIVISSPWQSSGSPTASISDTEGNTYATAVGRLAHNLTNPFYSQIWYAKNIKGGANTVTITYSQSLAGVGAGADMEIHEYSGLDASNPFDVSGSATGSSAAVSSSTSTTNAANELIVGLYGGQGGTSSAGSGFTLREASGNDITEDKIVSIVSSYQTTFTQSGAVGWIAAMATFRASGSPVALMSNTGTVTNSTGRVKYRLSVGASQAAGTYKTQIIYIINGTF